jgi:hypothetical protein
MAWLIIEHDGKRAAGVIRGRIIIGRWASSQVCLSDQRVSRIHAWIAPDEEGQFFLTDAGSRTGTFVNDRQIAGRVDLRHGDRIRIGPVRLHVAEDAAEVENAEALDLDERPMPMPSPEMGIFFSCPCDAPVWVPWEFAGRVGLCRSCGAPLSVPGQPGQVAPREGPLSAAGPVDADPMCGVCHSPIAPLEESTRCPACRTEFHVECWTENRGCSVYGCSHVNALEPPEHLTPHVEAVFLGVESPPIVAEQTDETAIGSSVGIPWAYALLAASVLGTVLGALTFGATALLAACAATVYLLRGRPLRQRGVVVLSIVVASVGTLAGVAVSHYWWMGNK